jgi:hypothetical protein
MGGDDLVRRMTTSRLVRDLSPPAFASATRDAIQWLHALTPILAVTLSRQ